MEKKKNDELQETILKLQSKIEILEKPVPPLPPTSHLVNSPEPRSPHVPSSPYHQSLRPPSQSPFSPSRSLAPRSHNQGPGWPSIPIPPRSPQRQFNPNPVSLSRSQTYPSQSISAPSEPSRQFSAPSLVSNEFRWESCMMCLITTEYTNIIYM